MCLGVPGQVVSIQPDPLGMSMAKVSFGGITKEVCLAYTPEVEEGDYVVVHVGFAIARIDEEEAAEVWRYLEEMGELAELEIEQPEGVDVEVREGDVLPSPAAMARRRSGGGRPPEGGAS